MRKPKAGVAASLALALLTAACSSGNQGDTKAAESAGKENRPGTEGTGLPIVKDKVSMNFLGMQYPITKDFNTLDFFQFMKEKTNVDIKWEMTPTGTASVFKEKKNLIFASGELPDAFYGHLVLDADEILKYGSQGQLIPLEGLIDKYAPNFKKMVEAHPEYKKEITAPDGHIYSLPTIDESYPNSRDAIFINKKWLDQLNLPMPTTAEEFYNTLKAFKDKDMNGNGKKDEIPFTFRAGNYNTSILSFFGAFGLTDRPDHIYMDGDTVKYTAIQPEYKDAIQYMNRLFKEGLADQEALTHDEKVYYAKVRSTEKNVGAFSAWSISTIFDSDQNSDFVLMPPLKGPKGQLWNRYPVGILSKGAFAISSRNKYPELTMRWIDYNYDPMVSFQAYQGMLGKVLKQREDGKIEYLPVPQGMTAGDFRHMTAPGASSVFAVTKELADKIVQPPTYNEKAKYDEGLKPYLTKKIFPNVYFSIEENQLKQRYFTDIDPYVSKMNAKWMMQGGIEAEWGDYLKKLSDMGLEKMLKVYQDVYNRYKDVK